MGVILGEVQKICITEPSLFRHCLVLDYCSGALFGNSEWFFKRVARGGPGVADSGAQPIRSVGSSKTAVLFVVLCSRFLLVCISSSPPCIAWDGQVRDIAYHQASNTVFLLMGKQMVVMDLATGSRTAYYLPARLGDYRYRGQDSVVYPKW